MGTTRTVAPVLYRLYRLTWMEPTVPLVKAEMVVNLGLSAGSSFIIISFPLFVVGVGERVGESTGPYLWLPSDDFLLRFVVNLQR